MKKYCSKEYLTNQLNKKDYIQIAKENNVSTSTIQRWMRRYGLTKKYDYWSKQEKKSLKKNYEDDINIYELLPHRSISSINHKASRLGLKRKFVNRKYPVNHNFFKKWSPEMAYVLGFFFSDGYVSSDRQVASIHLSQKDHYILERINSIIESNRQVYVHSKSSYLKIDSQTLANDLVKLGCTPRKSQTLKFPSLKNNFLSHFVRGYFDGDGSIHFNKPNTIKVSFVSTKEFLEEMQLRISKILRTKSNPINKVKSVWNVYYYGDDARKLCDWMYKNSKNLYLKRKKDKYDNHLKLRKNGGI